MLVGGEVTRKGPPAAGTWQGQPRSLYKTARGGTGPLPRGEGGPGPPRPVVAVWPVMVRPSHVAAPDPLGSPGPRGQPVSPPALLGFAEAPDLLELWEGPETVDQLSGPGNVPRHPEGEGEIMDYETPRAWTP
jgi:hypothetical protein